jgi:hypothetical protein
VLFDLGVVVGLLRARMMIDAFKVFVFIVVIMYAGGGGVGYVFKVSPCLLGDFLLSIPFLSFWLFSLVCLIRFDSFIRDFRLCSSYV